MKNMATKKIFGSPGTGKTTYILNDIFSRVTKENLFQFCYIVFTRAAKEDFIKRMKKTLNLEEETVRQMWVGTQHVIVC